MRGFLIRLMVKLPTPYGNETFNDGVIGPM